MLRRRAWPEVGIERLEVLAPLLTDEDPPTAIVMELGMV
jgi:hypothetical protein